MNNPEEAPKLQVPCRNLRSQEMYYQSIGQPANEFTSGSYWCIKTHEPFGPDGQVAGERECCAGRSCYI